MKIICRQSPPMEITKVRDAPTGIDHLGNLFRGIVLLGANRSESNFASENISPHPESNRSVLLGIELIPRLGTQNC